MERQCEITKISGKTQLAPNCILDEITRLGKSFEPVDHKKILELLLGQVKKVNFRELAGLENEKESLQKKHYLVLSIEKILETAQINNWGICKNLAFTYLYNGSFWNLIDNGEFQDFLGAAAEKTGIEKFDSRHYVFREQLFKQFLASANLPSPDQSPDKVLINLQNGTFEFTPERQVLRPPQKEDFITYQLPFKYDPQAKAPLFMAYLDKVQPDIERQDVLAEFLGYLFVRPSTLKLEKTLLLYGPGANGKSVFFEVVNTLLGQENTSCYSLQNLCDESGYYRAKLANKLLNYSSEINGKLETSIFKQLVSGEPVSARLPYGEPFDLTNYGKLIFNCNQLPTDTEQTNAFYRRFIIVPFEVTIAEPDQDKQLSQKIIRSELAGVFNWILSGLKRLLVQKNFTQSKAVTRQLEIYREQSDTVRLFMSEEGYSKSINDYTPLKELFALYRQFCTESGYRSCSVRTFSERLKGAGYEVERKTIGNVVYAKINVCF